MEKLIIKKFGAIVDVNLEIRKTTILIGGQATGKSTVAKVLAICRYLSFIENYDLQKSNNNSGREIYTTRINIEKLIGFEYWDLIKHFKEGTYIEYENEDYVVKFENVAIGAESITPDGEKYNKTLVCTHYLEIKSKRFSSLINEQNEREKYILAGRFMNNPFFIHTERVLQSVFTLGKNSTSNLGDYLYDYYKKMDGFYREVTSFSSEVLEGVKYEAGNGKPFLIDENSSMYPIKNAASGYQSTIPIFAAVKYYTDIKKKPKTFIIEEPEISLFPNTQVKLMKYFIKEMNINQHSFLLTTHSPYLLSAVNDMILAHIKGQHKKIETKNIIAEEYWLDHNNFIAYQLEKGKSKCIINKHDRLIKDNIIDDEGDKLGDVFDQLINL